MIRNIPPTRDVCLKGIAPGETTGLEGPLLHPVVSGKRTGWLAAPELVAGRFADTIARYGPDSVAFCLSG